MSNDINEHAFTTVIDAQALANLFEHKNTVVIDCRFNLAEPAAGRNAYLDGHIPGAQYAHLDEDLSGIIISGTTGRHPLPDAGILADRIGKWGVNNLTQVVVYDSAGGAIAARLWWMFNWLGHDRVAVLDGGWQAWVEGGYPTSSHISEANPGLFTATVDSNLVVTAADILQILDQDEWLLLDARAPLRYRGIEEPLDPVAGHIPGAASVPFKENLDEDGMFLSSDDLSRRFGSATGSTRSDHVITYCGSGVTGAHNVLAMKHAGLGMPKLYAGSWSEWITDPKRPIASGGE